MCSRQSRDKRCIIFIKVGGSSLPGKLRKSAYLNLKVVSKILSMDLMIFFEKFDESLALARGSKSTK